MGGPRQTDPGDRVQVVVRVRPAMEQDGTDSPALTCSTSSRRVQVVCPGKEVERSGTRSYAQARAFEFDACLDAAASQGELFDACRIAELVDAALAGFSVTVFAFGQTGSGKTFSLFGPTGRGPRCPGAELHSSDGLVSRALHRLYRAAEEDEATQHTMRASFCEIYNEQVRDLCGNTRTPLPVRHNQRHGFFVDGLQSTCVPDLEDARAAVAAALTSRAVGAHKLNRHSSRSHCMLTFELESTPCSSPEAVAARASTAMGMRRYGKLCFVDLAGSERLKETGSVAASSVRETGNINRSLFALGKVISALSERPKSSGSERSSAFVPYRDSKLTQLLINSLRGTGRALMLACCSPSTLHLEETMNTLHFASLALRVRSQPVLLLDPADQLVINLRNTIKELRNENQRLMQLLQAGGMPSSPRSVDPHPAPGETPSSRPKNGLGPVSSGSGQLSHADESIPPRPANSSQSSNGPAEDVSVSASPPRVKPRKAASSRRPHAHKAAAASSAYSSSEHDPRAGPRAAWGVPAPPTNAQPPESRRPEVPMASPAAPSALGSFPELAALEAQFQEKLGKARTCPPDVEDGNSYASSSACWTGTSTTDTLNSTHNFDEFPSLATLEAQFGERLKEARATNAKGGVSNVPKPKPKARAKQGPAPEEKAAMWAMRNKWFGADVEMTESAYAIHDELMAEHVDPSSDYYYDQIEDRVRQQFPARFIEFSKSGDAKSSSRSLDNASRNRENLAKDKEAPVSSKQAFKSQRRKLPRGTDNTSQANTSVRQILKYVNSANYSTSTGSFDGHNPDARKLSSTGNNTLHVSTWQPESSPNHHSYERMSRSPSKLRSRTGSGTKWVGGSSDNSSRIDVTGQSAMSTFIVNNQSFLERRMAVLEELRHAKEEALAEQQRLQARIRRRLEMRQASYVGSR